MDFSRDSYYRFRDRSVIKKSSQKPILKNRIDPSIEEAVVNFAIDKPAYGQHRVSNELRKVGVFVSGGGVRSIWLMT